MVKNTDAAIFVVDAGAGDVVAATVLVDAAEVVPLADTCKQHASNVTEPYQHALSPPASRPVSQHE